MVNGISTLSYVRGSFSGVSSLFFSGSLCGVCAGRLCGTGVKFLGR